jgi:hypothetical protein
MKMTRKDIIDEHNIVGHIVLMSGQDAIKAISTDLDTNGAIEVKLMYGDKELNLDGFIEHWQSQIDEMILKEAEQLIDDKLRHPINDLNDICNDAVKTIKEKIGIKDNDWY